MFRATLIAFVIPCLIGNCWSQNIYPWTKPVETVTNGNESVNANQLQPNMPIQIPVTCSCGVFLSGQFVRGSPKPPVGYPPITAELEEQFPCSKEGVKLCTNKCLENLAKHLSKSQEIICASIDRDCFKERAHLFVKNCNSPWLNTNLGAGKEYCCKNNEFYKCPAVSF